MAMQMGLLMVVQLCIQDVSSRPAMLQSITLGRVFELTQTGRTLGNLTSSALEKRKKASCHLRSWRSRASPKLHARMAPYQWSLLKAFASWSSGLLRLSSPWPPLSRQVEARSAGLEV